MQLRAIPYTGVLSGYNAEGTLIHIHNKNSSCLLKTQEALDI